MSEEKPKIIIDEGWKAQVEAEKAAARHPQQEQPSPGVEERGRSRPLPPASLTFLATTLATQAMVAMGLVPDPLDKKSERRMDEAQHFIDTLQMLQDKTQGNRTPEETAVLEGLLHELRLGFVTVQSAAPA